SGRAPGRVVAVIVFSLLGGATGCLDLEDPGRDTLDTSESVAAITITEGFEAGTKTSFAAADVTLATGVWNLDDALIGTLDTDVKTGTRSVRLRNSGKLTMKFDRTTGAGTVTIHHASFGADASGTWALFSSRTGGTTWTQVGSSRTTT